MTTKRAVYLALLAALAVGLFTEKSHAWYLIGFLKPDLTVVNISYQNGVSRIRVKNVGYGTASACRMVVGSSTYGVPPLSPGEACLFFYHVKSRGGARYHVDIDDTVDELYETNNEGCVFDPTKDTIVARLPGCGSGIHGEQADVGGVTLVDTDGK